MKNITNLLLAALVVLVALGIFKNHSLNLNISEHKNNTISVSGKAEKEVVPDTAKISFAVNEYKKNQKDAGNLVNKKVKKIISEIKNLGIDEKDIKTLNYSVYPNYRWNNGKRIFENYRASQRVEIKIRDLEKTSKILAKLVELRADNINGPNMFVDKIDEIRENLRKEAIENAKKKAEKLAAELGVKLDKIVAFSENYHSYTNRPIMYKAMAFDTAAMGEKVEEAEINPGQEKITKSVSITFQIED